MAIFVDNEEYGDNDDGDDGTMMMLMVTMMMIAILTKTEDITCQFYSENRPSLNKERLVPGICGTVTSPL